MCAAWPAPPAARHTVVTSSATVQLDTVSGRPARVPEAGCSNHRVPAAAESPLTRVHRPVQRSAGTLSATAPTAPVCVSSRQALTAFSARTRVLEPRWRVTLPTPAIQPAVRRSSAYQGGPAGATYAGYFRNDSANGTGVQVLAQSGSYGVYSSAAGVGVYGRTPNANGIAVRGEATYSAATPAYGGYFTCASGGGLGVYGYASAPFGPTAGVLGEAFSPDGWAVYAAGRFGAGGTKSFRIDHPLDPQNKWLLHYCSEAPEPQNFYNGNVVTDANGYAWVDLPDYFATINTEFKYQLTVVDDADEDEFVLAKVSKEIRGSRFQIRTSAPHTKVSWRVDAPQRPVGTQLWRARGARKARPRAWQVPAPGALRSTSGDGNGLPRRSRPRLLGGASAALILIGHCSTRAARSARDVLSRGAQRILGNTSATSSLWRRASNNEPVG